MRIVYFEANLKVFLIFDIVDCFWLIFIKIQQNRLVINQNEV